MEPADAHPPDDRPEPSYRPRALLLFAFAGFVLAAHVIDVLQSGGPSWIALAVRCGWAASLVANGMVSLRASGRTARAFTQATSLASAVFFSALLLVTGRSGSPLFDCTYVIVPLLLFILPERLPVAAASAATLTLAMLLMLLVDGAPRSALLGWAHTSAVALLAGAVGGRAMRAAQLAREREAAARQVTLTRLVESERLAAIGRLADDVAHEVNSPLAAARANANFLRQAHTADPEVAAAHGDLVAALDRIAASVRQLQDEPGARARQSGEASR